MDSNAETPEVLFKIYHKKLSRAESQLRFTRSANIKPPFAVGLATPLVPGRH